MGQREVWAWLKSNEGCFFTVREVADVLKINVKNVYTALEQLESSPEVVVKDVVGKNNVLTKLYGYVPKSEGLSGVLGELNAVRSNRGFEFQSAENVLLMKILLELRSLKEAVKNGCEKRV